jgi:hypothetical protein
MSEFSESFHSYQGGRTAVVSLLHDVGVSGLIAGSNERCVSFILDDPERETDVVAASRGVLARYYHAEDHGLWVRYYQDGKDLTRVALVWDDMGEYPEVAEEVEPTDQIVKKLTLAGVIKPAGPDELRRILEEFSPDDLDMRMSAVQVIPKLLGLAAYEWLSTAYVLSTELEDLRLVFPDAQVVKIGAD